MSADGPPLRTCSIDYYGNGTMGDFFGDLVDLLERKGMHVEGAADGPYVEDDDAWT